MACSCTVTAGRVCTGAGAGACWAMADSGSSAAAMRRLLGFFRAEKGGMCVSTVAEFRAGLLLQINRICNNRREKVAFTG